MALDRFVYWRGSDRPTAVQLIRVLEDYFYGFGLVTPTSDGPQRIAIFLPGKPHSATRSIYPEHTAAAVPTVLGFSVQEWRVVEVFIDSAGEYVDVITRQTDHITNAVAEGLAALYARLWPSSRDS
jgi:hypothetical protein